MPLMKGRAAVRRTLDYLQRGDVIFRSAVKIMAVNYNTSGTRSDGTRKFVFFTVPQIQFKNPWVQIVAFKNVTPSPFLRFYLDTGEQILVDVEDKTNQEITAHVKKLMGKSPEQLAEDERARLVLSNPANFGRNDRYERKCLCEVEGQVPCPAIVPLPKEMRGKYRNAKMEDTA
ncbi:small ribosomal subunit protein mS25 [Lethenteron reissneri]|uniref:small ribosomal subunit protein mS25 n=1 Tax=Lethenteron reissneri TaxID=7753 RepID=UPI002AB62767|nr:small ribosomal subunit protein mS25 [Lethenteron reissneri]